MIDRIVEWLSQGSPQDAFERILVVAAAICIAVAIIPLGVHALLGMH